MGITVPQIMGSGPLHFRSRAVFKGTCKITKRVSPTCPRVTSLIYRFIIFVFAFLAFCLCWFVLFSVLSYVSFCCRRWFATKKVEYNKFWTRWPFTWTYVACWFSLTLYGQSSKVEVIGLEGQGDWSRSGETLTNSWNGPPRLQSIPEFKTVNK